MKRQEIKEIREKIKKKKISELPHDEKSSDLDSCDIKKSEESIDSVFKDAHDV